MYTCLKHVHFASSIAQPRIVCIASDIEDFNIRMSEFSSFTSEHSEMSSDHPLCDVVAQLQRENDTLRQENDTLTRDCLLLGQVLAPYREGFNAIFDALQQVANTTANLPHPIRQPVAAAAVAMAAMPARPASGYELGPPAMSAAAAAAAGPPPEPVRGLLVEPFPEPAIGTDLPDLPPPPTATPPAEPQDPLADSLADPPPPPLPPPPLAPPPAAGPPPLRLRPLSECQGEGCDYYENRAGERRGFPGYCCHWCSEGPSLENGVPGMLEPSVWHGKGCQKYDFYKNQF